MKKIIVVCRENGTWLVTTNDSHVIEDDNLGRWCLSSVTADETIDPKGAMFTAAIFNILGQEGIEEEDEDQAVEALRQLFRMQRERREEGDEDHFETLQAGLERLLTTIFRVGQVFGDYMASKNKQQMRLLIPKLH